MDPYYLTWKAREYGFHTSMIETSMIINDKMPEYCVERAAMILNNNKKALNGSKVLVFGVAYKGDIDDYRESPAIPVIDLLKLKGAEVEFYDPYIKEYKAHGTTFTGLSDLTPEIISNFDLVMITCGHTKFDYSIIQKNAKMIFDTKNIMSEIIDRRNIEVL